MPHFPLIIYPADGLYACFRKQ